MKLTLRDVITASRKALADGTLAAAAKEAGTLDATVCQYSYPGRDAPYGCAIGVSLPDDTRGLIMIAGSNMVAIDDVALAAIGIEIDDHEMPAIVAVQTIHDGWMGGVVGAMRTGYPEALAEGFPRLSRVFVDLHGARRSGTREDFVAALDAAEKDLVEQQALV